MISVVTLFFSFGGFYAGNAIPYFQKCGISVVLNASGTRSIRACGYYIVRESFTIGAKINM
jgi:hypothetical protein